MRSRPSAAPGTDLLDQRDDLLGDPLDAPVLLFLEPALVAAADDAERARADIAVGANRQTADLVPAQPLDLERVHRHRYGRERAVAVVDVDRPADDFEVLGLGAHAGRASCSIAWSIVLRRPSRRSTSGSQPSRSFAREMSGWRTLGSSTGSASKTISERDSVSSITALAISSSVISFGFPMLTGSWTPDSMRAMRPRTRSST